MQEISIHPDKTENDNTQKDKMKTKSMTSREYEQIFIKDINERIKNDYANIDAVTKRALSLASPLEGKTVLDVGCGFGQLVDECRKKGAKSYGIDYSKKSIDAAKKRYPGSKYLVGELTNSRLKSDSFDAIFAIGVVGYLSDRAIFAFLEKVKTLLKPDGSLIVRLNPPTYAYFEFFIKTYNVIIGKEYHSRARKFWPNELKHILNSAGFKTRILLRVDTDTQNPFKKFIFLMLYPFTASLWAIAKKTN